jgi:hypothetical protein
MNMVAARHAEYLARKRIRRPVTVEPEVATRCCRASSREWQRFARGTSRRAEKATG